MIHGNNISYCYRSLNKMCRNVFIRVYIVKSSCESHMDRGLFYRVYFGYRAVSAVDFIKSTYGEGCYSCWFSV
jgi:hypothetical protein